MAEISHITERNAGTHFLLSVRTRLSEAEVRQAGLAADLSLSMYSDYSYSEAGGEFCTLVINYAGIEQEKIPELGETSRRYFPGVLRQGMRQIQSGITDQLGAEDADQFGG